MSESETNTFNHPNKYARPPRLDLDESKVTFHGYQEFELTRDSLRVLPVDTALLRKQHLLAPFFRRDHLKNRSVLDLGANAAFFCFWALQNGAERAVAVDMDDSYLAMIEEARIKLGYSGLASAKANVAEWTQPADVVVALALIHWIYSCTAVLGSLDDAVGKLAELTKYMLLIEWVDPDDAAIAFFGHLDWNKERARGPYTQEAFEEALAHHFEAFQGIGPVSPTRRLYVAFRSRQQIDLSNPLPLIRPLRTVIYSRFITEHHGVEYWSRVYVDNNVVLKQATRDLASREAFFLSEFHNDHFPVVVRSRSENGYSVIVLERIRGMPLEEAQATIREDPRRLHKFFDDCLAILAELQAKGIVHRDIRRDNLLLRNGEPVLIDFGFAISKSHSYFTPLGLGEGGRPPEGGFCDVYSMGKVFEEIHAHRYSLFDAVIELMTDPEPSLRLIDPCVLQSLFVIAAEAIAERTKALPSTAPAEASRASVAGTPVMVQRTALELLEQVSKRNRLLQSQYINRWSDRLQTLARELDGLIPPKASFILVDEAQLGGDLLEDRTSIPFLERDGQYWGPPPDSQTAVRELQRLQKAGATFLVFAWPAFWWLDYYAGLHEYLRATFRCLMENGRLIVFDLRV